jgi:hypothetical protein
VRCIGTFAKQRAGQGERRTSTVRAPAKPHLPAAYPGGAGRRGPTPTAPSPARRQLQRQEVTGYAESRLIARVVTQRGSVSGRQRGRQIASHRVGRSRESSVARTIPGSMTTATVRLTRIDMPKGLEALRIVTGEDRCSASARAGQTQLASSLEHAPRNSELRTIIARQIGRRAAVPAECAEPQISLSRCGFAGKGAAHVVSAGCPLVGEPPQIARPQLTSVRLLLGAARSSCGRNR